MMIPSKMKSQDILGLAVRSEIEAASFYSRLLGKVRNLHLREKLKFLVFEEKKHKKILERLFSERYSGQKMNVPDRSPIRIPVAPARRKMTVPEMFKAALQTEKDAEDFYKQARKNAEEEGSRRMLLYLSRVERSHYFMIKSEIELFDLFPYYYNVEDFHVGQDMFHVGA